MNTLSGHRVLALAHRGASEGEQALENSREAFRRAVDLAADGVELDIHATADGSLVVHHDPDLPGIGTIAELDTRDVVRARLPNGEFVPLLGEVLDIIGEHDVWVEVKSMAGGVDASLLTTLDAGPAPDRYAVHSFDHRIIARLGRLRPTLRRGILLASHPVDVLRLLAEAEVDTLWMVRHFIDRELVSTVHDSGAGVIAWTVNEEKEIERVAELGVDGICGDFPERIVRVTRRGMA
ncbi:MAG: glycerophosphodiester phosphodiesterase [Gemmatimonadales bacterium]|nr:glycerophosphodiester phosphodiesterase [Gemmatimonadales bacterium]